MATIVKATTKDAQLLANIGKTSFIESHGSSASEETITEYVTLKFTKKVLEDELKDPSNIYHIIYHCKKAIGYSKIIFNASNSNVPFENVTKLERFYVLQEFHDLKLGLELFNFIIQESKKHNQAGIWLFTWTENKKAINFYTKAEFKIIGNFDFKISDTHYNPNYQMLLTY
jgi:ribosomal protein S18 acetylase RimI-like enzyme